MLCPCAVASEALGPDRIDTLAELLLETVISRELTGFLAWLVKVLPVLWHFNCGNGIKFGLLVLHQDRIRRSQ